MSSTQDLRSLQIQMKKLPRSIRRKLPLIYKKTKHSIGVITYYLDGFGTHVDIHLQILKAIEEIQAVEPKHVMPKRKILAKDMPARTEKKTHLF